LLTSGKDDGGENKEKKEDLADVSEEGMMIGSLGGSDIDQKIEDDLIDLGLK
jgi:hypothetical protein